MTKEERKIIEEALNAIKAKEPPNDIYERAYIGS